MYKISPVCATNNAKQAKKGGTQLISSEISVRETSGAKPKMLDRFVLTFNNHFMDFFGGFLLLWGVIHPEKIFKN